MLYIATGCNFFYAFQSTNLFRLHQIFTILTIQMLLYQIQQAPGPDFRKVGKSDIIPVLVICKY